ncbi:unnamed protein product [Ascophyllum nodosum]
MNDWTNNDASTSRKGRNICVSAAAEAVSDGVSSSSTSSVELISVPRLVERSPTLVKANMAVATSAAAQERALPCRLALHGTRPTAHTRRCGARRTTSEYGVSESLDVYRTSAGSKSALLHVVIRTRPRSTVGYSPRLRMLDWENFHGTKTAQGPTSPPPANSASPARRRNSNAADESKDEEHSDPRGTADLQNVHRDQPPRINRKIIATPYDLYCQNESQLCSSSGATGFARNIPKGGVKMARQYTAPYSIVGKAQRPCGHLYKGIVASSKPEIRRGYVLGEGDTAVRPRRTLFLVSGQSQRIDSDTRMRSPRCTSHGGRRPASARLFSPRDTLLSSTRRKVRAAQPGGRGRQNSSVRNKEGGDVILATLPSQDSTRLHTDDYNDVGTVRLTAGKGDSTGRRVLHVRLPRTPPTSLLVLRSAPPRCPDPA